MRKVKFRDWEFEVDYEFTQRTYNIEKNGALETCDCGYCINFRKQKSKVYPNEVLILFEKLGIDYSKEEEVSEVYKTESDLHNYIGWFHFAGKILSGKSCKKDETNEIELNEIDQNFSIGFCEQQELNKNTFVKIWFETDIPLIIE